MSFSPFLGASLASDCFWLERNGEVRRVREEPDASFDLGKGEGERGAVSGEILPESSSGGIWFMICFLDGNCRGTGREVVFRRKGILPS